MSNTATVLLTGATGFIAKRICLQLLNAGYEVRASVRTLDRGQEVVDAVAPHLKADEDLRKRLRFVALDLSKDDGWDEALSGTDALVHTASPAPVEQPKDENDLIRPAVDGTLRALRSAKEAGTKRVVLTSSIVAINCKQLAAGKSLYDEDDWSDLNDPTATPYVKSKTLAEAAAWEFVERESPDMALTAINPGFVLGPPLDHRMGPATQILQRLMRGKDPAVPRVGFSIVDVRDIAELHVKALSNSNTAGKRLIGTSEFLWLTEIAAILAKAYPKLGIPRRTAPDWLVRSLALFDKTVRASVPRLNRAARLNNARAQAILGSDFIASEATILEAADYLSKNQLID